MVNNFDSSVVVARKLLPKHMGPYVIDKVLRNDKYLIKDVEGFQLSRCPYQGVWSSQILSIGLENENNVRTQRYST